jgi:hypothetical protein
VRPYGQAEATCAQYSFMNTNKLIEIAKALKPISWKQQCFHVTIACCKGRPLAIATNKPKCTHPKNLMYDYKDQYGKPKNKMIGLHSELAAILRLGRDDCRDISFYVLRIDNNGNPNMSKPCSGCMSVFNQIGYKNIYYTNRNGQFERM